MLMPPGAGVTVRRWQGSDHGKMSDIVSRGNGPGIYLSNDPHQLPSTLSVK